MHFLELLEQVSDRDTAVYYAENCDEAAPKASYTASKTLIDGNYSFTWSGTKQGHEFWSKIYKKLSTHPQNQKVTYELNVYEQYKNEVFEVDNYTEESNYKKTMIKGFGHLIELDNGICIYHPNQGQPFQVYPKSTNEGYHEKV